MTTSNDLTQLPRGWVWTRLGEIGMVTSGGTPSTKDDTNFNGPVPWITPADLSGYDKTSISGGKRNLSEKGLNSSSATLLPKGTVLFSSRAPIGYVVIAKNNISTNQGFKNLILGKNIFNEYVYYYLKGNKELAESYASGTTFKELSAKTFALIPFPLSPLPEQHRIVAKIEELFTRLDAGVEALKKVKAELKRYRQAVLKAAMEGKLTEGWREEHKGELEPASLLLKRIKEERKKKLGKKYKELPPVDTVNFGELPDGWVWATYEQIGNWMGGGTPSKRNPAYWKSGTIPWITPKDMKSLKIKDTQDKITELAIGNTAAKMIPTGSLLFVVRSGILRRTLPIAVNEVDATVNQDLKVLIPNTLINSDDLLFSALALSDDIRHSCAKDGTTVESIEVPALREYLIPLPSPEEQHKIVEEIERLFSVADAAEKAVEQSLKQAGRLRQSILKKAFEGKLVPQDPSDKPAEKLLERIKEEKAKKNIKIIQTDLLP